MNLFTSNKRLTESTLTNAHLSGNEAASSVAIIVSAGGAMILADNIGWELTYMIMAGLMGMAFMGLMGIDPAAF